MAFFVLALLGTLLLGGCGGGSNRASELISGTAAVGVPLDGAAVRMRCADGSVFETTTNGLGVWQIVVSTRPLPCALQVSGGNLSGTTNTTAYHSVANSYGNHNITPLTSLVFARALGSSPQAWFDSPSPDFSRVNQVALQTAAGTVSSALGLTTALRQADPLTKPFIVNRDDYFFRVLYVIQAPLPLLAVNKRYPELLDSAIAGDLETQFSTFSATFASEMLRLFPI